MSLRSPICPSSHKEKKMSDAELDEGTPITLEDAAYVARDGIILLECVNGIDDARAGRGELTVHTDTGSFNLRVDLQPNSRRRSYAKIMAACGANIRNILRTTGAWRLRTMTPGSAIGNGLLRRSNRPNSKTRKTATQSKPTAQSTTAAIIRSVVRPIEPGTNGENI